MCSDTSCLSLLLRAAFTRKHHCAETLQLGPVTPAGAPRSSQGRWAEVLQLHCLLLRQGRNRSQAKKEAKENRGLQPIRCPQPAAALLLGAGSKQTPGHGGMHDLHLGARSTDFLLLHRLTVPLREPEVRFLLDKAESSSKAGKGNRKQHWR